MPNLATTDDLAANHGTVCFRPADDDDRRGNGGRCYHAVDTGSVSPCFRPDDDQPAASATDPGRPVSPCLRPDDGDVNSCFRPDDDQPAAGATDPGRPSHPCFHPDDGNVNSCFHPEEPPVNSCRRAGDDLVSDLHLALTGVEEQHLATLAVRS